MKKYQGLVKLVAMVFLDLVRLPELDFDRKRI